MIIQVFQPRFHANSARDAKKNIDKSPINRAFTDSATHKRQYIKIELFCFLIKLQVFQPRFQANSARVAKKNIDRGTTDTAFTR